MTTRTFTVRVSDSAGNETVGTKTFQVGTGETILTGDIDAVVLAGTTARLVGNCRLVNNLHVRGTLICDETFVLDGQNLYDIHTHDGGVLNLQGTEKTAWCNWGDAPVGWQVGDSLAVAATAPNVYNPLLSTMTTTWRGSWATTVRPTNSLDVLLADGTIARPEVVNRSQTAVIKNVTRIMMHESGGVPNVHTLKWLKVLDSGKASELGFYPVHLHMLGDSARGSLVEGVLVEGGKHHAFVPHGSHGITFTGCAALVTFGSAYWWDLPPEGSGDSPVNNSNDIVYDRCLALRVLGMPFDSLQYTGFAMGAGLHCVCKNSVVAGVSGTGQSQRAGFLWGENRDFGAWKFTGNVAHNCFDSGIFVWQNTRTQHPILDFTVYRCGFAGIDHGAYGNNYHYQNISLTEARFMVHAKTFQPVPGVKGLLLEDILSDSILQITAHGIPDMVVSVIRNSTFPQVVYTEVAHPSFWRYEDCGLTPADFRLTGGSSAGLPVKIHASSIIEIVEGGVVTDRWVAGVWS